MSTGPNDHCSVRQRGPFLRAADRRVAKIPEEYRVKAKSADKQFAGGGTRCILNALSAMPEAKGSAFGAPGEFSSSVNALKDGPAHEGVIENPDRFGRSNYMAAYGAIHGWLKRRLSRPAVITAVASRHGAMRYACGSAQRPAAR